MYFKKLELVGFKSFMDKTVLHFEPGITAVVGPNGCGKSNIFDAIRWVLGEQSVKSLRGSQMEDVIFNGTDREQPLGMAEVSLAFDNSNRFLNVDDSEVIITRRIFRSGESEYMLNKVAVRLKDILDLLMGTGIGAESYSLVAQGKIDLILSSRPEDRRLVFDEAAGITKYKANKREALRKLEETEQNLLRVNDIITEVKRQIGSLERQANKARRYKEVFEELKSQEMSLGFLQKANLTKEKYQLTLELSALREEEESLQKGIQEGEETIKQRNKEIKIWDDCIANVKAEILNLEGLISRNTQQTKFNQERIRELINSRAYLEEQIKQSENRLAQDEDKLNRLKSEQEQAQRGIEEKTALLKEKENEFNRLVDSVKASLEKITESKKLILEQASLNTRVKNEVTDLGAKEQIFLARKKRLEIEKAKVGEEKTQAEENLNNLNLELKQLELKTGELQNNLCGLKTELEKHSLSLEGLDHSLQDLEGQLLALQSHKEFLDKLKTRYDDIATAMNAQVYLDQPVGDGLSGLIIKVKQYSKSLQADSTGRFELSGEAKPIDLDSKNVSEKISQIEARACELRNTREGHIGRINQLNQDIQMLREKEQEEQIKIGNKKAVQQAVFEQVIKTKDEAEIILSELTDVDSQLSDLSTKLTEANLRLSRSEEEQKKLDELIHREQESISSQAGLKEEVIVTITQVKTELDALTKRVALEANALSALEDNCRQDKQALLSLEKQLEDNCCKEKFLLAEIKDLENRCLKAQSDIKLKEGSREDSQAKYAEVSAGLSDVVNRIEEQKKAFDVLKDKVHSLQMEGKDIDFKYSGIKDKLMQAYKIDLDNQDSESLNLKQGVNAQALMSRIEELKDKLDSYGSVNLVAIEEYDELKKRYDFLIQQQDDLVKAKDSLQEAIRKINQTTRKMFTETFEKVREEFKNYFRLLFNGGDAQLFLIDEQDPLESGIEIICRPPGKKLQNVLLLSGGEKSMAAIALIFAIFKVKPAPFCVLDEIDAALDEANVDRFSRLLQEFTGNSQFIAITHNKRTIANADVMYGITMEQSGVSKIVSVKFASQRPEEEKEAVAA